VPAWLGFLFLAVVIDAYSRRCVGWSMRDDLKAELVVDALGMAVSARRPAAGLAIFEYIEAFYNPLRRHSTLGYKSPMEFERIASEETKEAAATQALTCPRKRVNSNSTPA